MAAQIEIAACPTRIDVRGFDRKAYVPREIIDQRPECRGVMLQGLQPMKPPTGRGETVVPVTLRENNGHISFTMKQGQRDIYLMGFDENRVPEGIYCYVEHLDPEINLPLDIYRARFIPTLRPTTHMNRNEPPYWYSKEELAKLPPPGSFTI